MNYKLLNAFAGILLLGAISLSMPLQAQESKTAQPVPPTPKSAPAPAQPTEPRSNPLPEKLDKVNQDSPAEPATEKSALPAKVEPVPQPKEMSPAPSPGPGETPGKSEPMRDGRGSPKSQPKVPVPSLTEPGSKESQLPTDKMTAVLDPSMKPEKKGETTRKWEEKWGYNSASKTPKASLWVLTDTGPQTDWVSPVMGATLQPGDPKTTPKNSWPCPGAADQEDQPANCAITINSQSGGVQWTKDPYDPTQGTAVEIEAQIDIVVTAPALKVALIYGNSAGMQMGPIIPVIGKVGEFSRIILISPINGGTQVLSGKQESPFAGKAPVTFGVMLIRDGKEGTTLTAIVDNFEVRVASQCTLEQRKEEQARRAEQAATLDKLTKTAATLDINKIMRDAGHPEITKETITSAEKQQMTGKPDKPVVSKTCCNDKQPTLDENGNLVIDPNEIPAGIDWNDAEVTGTANFVESEIPLEDQFSGMDQRTDSWLGNLPCSPSVGTFLPEGLEDILIKDSNEIAEIDPEESKAWEEAATDDKSNPKDDPKTYPNLDTNDIGPTPNWITNPGISTWRLQPNHQYAFGGRDIVYVQGLKLQHIYDAIIMNRGFAKKGWETVPGATSAQLYFKNRAFFPTTAPTLYSGTIQQQSYIGDLAFKNWCGDSSLSRATLAGVRGPVKWNQPGLVGFTQNPQFPADGHVAQFLFANGYSNRFMIVGYNCYERADVAVRALLGQVAMAMADGVGVYNPGHPGGLTPQWPTSPEWASNQSSAELPYSGFGRRGLVFISQSTGALIVDLAMSRASKTPQWKVGFIPERTRAHIAAQGAFTGSHVATTAYLASIVSGDFLLNMMAKQIYRGQADPFSPNNGDRFVLTQQQINSPGGSTSIKNGILNSIIQDLRPTIIQVRHLQDIVSTPVQTLTIAGGHPSSQGLKPKQFLHQGFDDNTVNSHATVAGLSPDGFWPHGMVSATPNKCFDLGLFGPAVNVPPVSGPFGLITVQIGTTYAAQPRRAIGYFLDQWFDPKSPHTLRDGNINQLNTSGGAIQPMFIACGGGVYLSPSGMVQEGAPLVSTPWSPYFRAPNHYGFLNVAGDHFETTHDQGSGSDIRSNGAWMNEMPSDIHYPDYEETEQHNGTFFGNSTVFSALTLNKSIPNVLPTREWNQEESLAVTSLTPYLPVEAPGVANDPGLNNYQQKNKPLLNGQNFPQNWMTRGCYIRVEIKIRKRVKWSKTWWFFKRSYNPLRGWREKMQFDYVYGTDYNGSPLGGVLRN